MLNLVLFYNPGNIKCIKSQFNGHYKVLFVVVPLINVDFTPVILLKNGY